MNEPIDFPTLEERQARVRELTGRQYPHLIAVEHEGDCDDCEQRALVRFKVGRFTVCRRCSGLRAAAKEAA